MIISDPTDDEESLATGVMTIVVTSEGKLCCVHKPGYSLFVFTSRLTSMVKGVESLLLSRFIISYRLS